MRPARLIALLCAILLCISGCLPQGSRAELAHEAADYLQKGEKARALEVLAQAQQAGGPGPTGDALCARWWDALTDIDGIPAEPLTEDECRGLSALAYLMSFADCALSPRELSKDNLLSPLVIYYGMSMSMPLYARPGWDALPFYEAYPPDVINIGQAYCSMSAKKANAFINQTMGLGIPDLNEEGEFCGGAVVCRDGDYLIHEQDILLPDLLVHAYRYLGDGLFDVTFDADDYGTPDPEESHTGIVPGSMRLIVRRSDSAWGFTAVAKLSGLYGEALPGEIRAIEDMARIENRSLKD